MITFGPRDERSAQQLQNCIDVSRDESPAVLCADHHPGYSMPIGGVIGLRNCVIPAGVGFDIGCGNCAVQTNIRARDVGIVSVMDEIWRVLSFGMGQKNDEKIKDHPVYDSIAKSPFTPQRSLLQLAQNQLGTIGGGNHYVDLFADRADDSLWIGVHFGSRGFGHKTASGFLSLGQGGQFDERGKEGDMDSAPLVLTGELKWDYLEAMRVAGEYAYAGRDWVVERVLQILQGKEIQRVHNHHNFAWWEKHGGEDLLVIRKGATPAFPGQKGFIGGTMGEDAVIIEGVESERSSSALYSTVHGAGRLMSRTQAAGKSRITTVWRCKKCNKNWPKETRGVLCEESCGGQLYRFRSERRITEGAINWPEVQADIKSKGITLRGAGADEAPGAYKRLPEVLGYHQGTINILHTLRPIGVAMAGPETEDLYKD